MVGETGILGRVKPGRGGYAREIIDHKHFTGAFPGFSGRQDLGRETLSALVAGRDGIAEQFSGLQREGTAGIRNLEACGESSAAAADIHFVVVGLGCGLPAVFRGLPGEGHFVAFQPGPELFYRQGLHYIGAVVSGTQVLEDAFVNTAGYGKAELRVQAVAHVGKILVGQQFQNHGRDLRDAAFAVGAVPDVAPGPERLVAGPDVLHHLALDKIGQQAACEALFSVREHFVPFAAEGVDGQGAHDGIVGRDPGVGMQGQGQVQRNFASGNIGRHAGTAAHLIHPNAAGRKVFLVVSFPFVQKGHVQAGILAVVQGAFYIGGQSGKGSFPFHLAHSAAETDGIGRDHPVVIASVAQRNIAFGSFVEVETAQIDPGAAAHLLVHVPKGFSAHVMDGVAGIDRAARQPDGLAVFSVVAAAGGAHTGRSHPERIVGAAVSFLGVGKTFAGVFPRAFFFVPALQADPVFAGSREGGIVVADHLPALGVPFPGRQDHGPGVLQHGHQEWNHVTLGIKVFHRAVGGAALPFPAAGGLFPVASVALPEGDVPAAQAFGPVVIAADQWRNGRAGIVHFEGGDNRLSVMADGGNHQLGDVLVLGINAAHRIVSQHGRGQIAQLLSEPGDIPWSPGIGADGCRVLKIQGLPLYRHFLQFKEDVNACAALETLLKGIVGFAEVPGAGLRKACGGQKNQKEEGREDFFHAFFFCFRMSQKRTMRVPRTRASESARKSRVSPLR